MKLCYAVGALAIVLAATLGFLRQRNQDAETRALTQARALAADVAARRPHPELAFAAVVGEPPASKYPFLRKRRWLLHPEAARVGRAVDDKDAHDLVAQAQRAGEVARFADDGTLTLALRAGGATAIVRLRPPGGKQPLPWGWLLLAIGLGGALAAAGRGRALAGAAGLALCAAICATMVAGPGSARLLVGLAALPGLALCWAHARGALAGLGRHGFAYAYVTPAGLGLLVLVLVPFAVGCVLGFFDHARGRYTFVGFGNFREILGSAEFYATLAVTIAWTAVNVLLHVAIGLALALALREPWVRLRGLFRVLLILPWAVPNYITALLWKGMFHQQYGAINTILSACGLARVSWFSGFVPAFAANVVTNTWLGFPFMMVVCLGALQSIPREVYEAAAVDGAGSVARFFRITLPLLRPALVPAVIIGSIWTFNQFNIIYLVSEGKPGGSTDILITEAYRWAFERGERYGLAAAYGLIIFLVLFAFCMLATRKRRAAEVT
ncbi:MAG TPA: sugar ABC transporter permease [Polyangia bacterium]|nr:sugar ABC transporter permease [Polyangia bacterium]